MRKLLLIDGHSLAYRAFYSSPLTMTLSDGQPINAVYGFMVLLFKALDLFNPDALCICFDRKEPTFRHQLYPEYKAHRPPSPDAFKTQIPLLLRAIRDLGLSVLDLAGFEADDLIGTLSLKAHQQESDTIILTGDKDELQLISDYVTVVMNKKGLSEIVTYTPDFLYQTMQLRPEQIVDFKALQGDVSDNIPGVAGIGEITAKKLLAEFGSLDAIYSQIDRVQSASVKAKLVENKDSAYLSYKLATINRDVPIDISLDSLKFTYDWGRIISVFQEFEFTSLVRKFQHHVGTPLFATLYDSTPVTHFQKPDGDYQLIASAIELESFLPALENGFAFDLETTAKEAMNAQIVGLSIAVEEKKAIYIPMNDYLTEVSIEVPLFAMMASEPKKKIFFQSNPFLDQLKPYFENSAIPKYTHHGKYDALILRNYGITVKNIAFDTMLAAYLLNSTASLGLKDLVKKHLKIEMTEYKEITQNAKINFSEVPIEVALPYAAADSDFTLRLTHLFQPQLIEKGVAPLYKDIELPLQSVLMDMEYDGVTIDVGYLAQLQTHFQLEITTLTQEIYQLAGQPFNLNSPKQVSEILFTKLGLPTIKKTKEGFSTDAYVLEKLAHYFDIAKLLLKHRTFEKLQNTYVKKLPLLVNPRTQRIHTSFNQTITSTGRLSSSSPNLQNIPIKSKEGEKIRKAFIPANSNDWILSADYSQIELRLMAHLSQDPTMIKAFQNQEDIHVSTAAMIFNVPISEVTKEMRGRAKTINFGIIYGMSSFGLSENLGISRTQAKEMIDQYFQNFPNIQNFIADTTEFVKNNGYVKTEFGRICLYPDIHSPQKSIQQMAIRAAVNARVQGTASDMIKRAMVRIQSLLKEKKYQSKMLIQVHDELVFDLKDNEKNILPSIIKTEMEQVLPLSVPLVVDLEIGKNWLEF